MEHSFQYNVLRGMLRYQDQDSVSCIKDTTFSGLDEVVCSGEYTDK